MRVGDGPERCVWLIQWQVAAPEGMHCFIKVICCYTHWSYSLLWESLFAMRNFINVDSSLNLWPLWPLDMLSCSSVHPLSSLACHLAVLPLLVHLPPCAIHIFLPWPEGLLPWWKGVIHINCQCWLPLWSSRKESGREWHEMRENLRGTAGLAFLSPMAPWDGWSARPEAQPPRFIAPIRSFSFH